MDHKFHVTTREFPVTDPPTLFQWIRRILSRVRSWPVTTETRIVQNKMSIHSLV